jgi:hypothetical protein
MAIRSPQVFCCARQPATMKNKITSAVNFCIGMSLLFNPRDILIGMKEITRTTNKVGAGISHYKPKVLFHGLNGRLVISWILF